MTRTWLLLLGALAAIGFASIVLVVLPQVVLVDVPVPEALVPSTARESRLAAHAAEGRRIYVREGCVYCHSQQVRDSTFTTDVQRGWGSRPTVPADYVLDRPNVLGTMRTGPDLANVGQRLPDADWHLIHLYQPRSLVPWSIMPSFRYLFEHRAPGDTRPGDMVIEVPGGFGPEGRVVVATPDAIALVTYLRSLRRMYPVPGTGAPTRGRSVHTMP